MWKEHGGEREKGIYFLCGSQGGNNVDRGILWRTLREKGLEEGILRKIEKIYERTEVAVRANGGLSGSFRTCRGSDSPLLFNLYMAEIDEMLKDRKIGGVEIGCERVWDLAYADDIVLLAKNKEALEDMMVRLENFLEVGS